MGKMTHDSICLLTEKNCNKNCELWEDCPIEKHDISDFKFIESVIKYLKKGENEKTRN